MLYYALKELLKRYRAYLLNVVVIGLATCMVLTLISLGQAYKEASRLPFKDIQGTIIVQKNGNVPETVSGVLLSCSLSPIHQDTIGRIGAIQGVGDVSQALSLWVFDPDRFKRVLGVNWQDGYGKSLAARIVDGAVPASDQEALVEKIYAGKNAVTVGNTIDIAGKRFTVTGLVGTAGNEIVASDAYINLAAAQDLAYQSGNLQAVEAFDKTDVNVVFISAGQQAVDGVTRQLKQVLATSDSNTGQTPLGQTIGNYSIYTPATFEEQISSIFRLSDRLTWVISLILLIGACLIIARNTLHAVLERRKEFGIMKTVGFRGNDIQRLISIETAVQVFWGFAVGMALTLFAIFLFSKTTVSIAIPWELSPYPHFLLANPDDANIVQTHFLPIRFDWLFMLVTLGAVMLIGLITALLATMQINKLKPVEILKNE